MNVKYCTKLLNYYIDKHKYRFHYNFFMSNHVLPSLYLYKKINVNSLQRSQGQKVYSLISKWTVRTCRIFISGTYNDEVITFPLHFPVLLIYFLLPTQIFALPDGNGLCKAQHPQPFSSKTNAPLGHSCTSTMILCEAPSCVT